MNDVLISKGKLSILDQITLKFFDEDQLCCEAFVTLKKEKENLKIFVFQDEIPLEKDTKMTKKLSRKGILFVENDQIPYTSFEFELKLQQLDLDSKLYKLLYEKDQDITFYVDFKGTSPSLSLLEYLYFHAESSLRKRNETLFIPKEIQQLSDNIFQIVINSKNPDFQKKCMGLLNSDKSNLKKRIDTVIFDWMKRTYEKTKE